MSEKKEPTRGPNLESGIPLKEIDDGGVLFGHVGDTPVAVVRDGDAVRAFDAVCTHYGAPLSDGIVRNRSFRCPWHHARFSMDDGTVVSPPALDPLPQRSVSLHDGQITVGDRLKDDPLRLVGEPAESPSSVLIVGAGAAGLSAAETLRREGYGGPVLLIDPDPDAPYDRPNLSKAFLAGEAAEEWMPLRSGGFFEDHRIDRMENRVARIEPSEQEVVLETGRRLPYGVLLLATGSKPRTLPVEGTDGKNVYSLRTFEDCRRLIEAVKTASSVAVVGASFIGMEVAASLKARGLEVTVVAPESTPFEAVFGSELGSFLHGLHDDNGVRFRLESNVEAVSDKGLTLKDDTSVEADLVVLGVGAEPDVQLARGAGLEVDDGVLVDRFLQTSADHVYAAGDIARYPDPRTGERIRIEHWVHAQRQGMAAARNILGHREPFTQTPFFWTKQFGVPLAYVGHADNWDDVVVEGDCGGGEDCGISYLRDGKEMAFAAIHRDRESLMKEARMEETLPVLDPHS